MDGFCSNWIFSPKNIPKLERLSMEDNNCVVIWKQRKVLDEE